MGSLEKRKHEAVSLLVLSAVSWADLPFGKGHSHDHDNSAPVFSGVASGFSFSRGGRQQDFFNTNFRSVSPQQPRVGRQETGVQGGVDFSGCVTDPDTGFCCVEKEETVTSLEKEPILECTHKNTEQCHYTYVTKLPPVRRRCVRTLRRLAPSPLNRKHLMRLCKSATDLLRRFAMDRGLRSAGLCMSHHVPPSMLRSSLASLLVTPPVKSYLLRSVVLAAPMRRGNRSAMTRLWPP